MKPRKARRFAIVCIIKARKMKSTHRACYWLQRREMEEGGKDRDVRGLAAWRDFITPALPISQHQSEKIVR